MTAYEFVPNNAVIVEIAPGVDRGFDPLLWPWTDVTDDVRVSERITIVQGRDNEATAVDAATCNLTFDNRSGDYCRTNPLGAYYGTLGRNTPLRVRVRPVLDAFGRTTASGWGTATSGQAWTTAGGSASDYATGSAVGTMLLGSVNVSRRATLATVDIRDGEVYAVFSAGAVATGNPLRAAVVFRAGADPSADHYRAQVNFELSGVLTLSLVDRTSGTDTTIDTGSVDGTYSAGTQVAVRVMFRDGEIYSRAWRVADGEPTDLNIASGSDTTHTTGAIGVRCLSATGNTNTNPTITTHAFEARVERFVGDVPEWAPRWDKSAVDQRVSVQAAGILRRLQQGAAPLKSSTFRYITANNPSAYWPLEDGTDARQAASAVAGQPPLVLTSGTAGFGGGAQPPGQPALYSMAQKSGTLQADISGVSSSRWQVEFAFRCTQSTSGQPRRVLSWFTNGAVSRWDIEIDSSGDAHLYTWQPAGRVLSASWGGVETFGSDYDLMAVDADQNGGDIDITVYLGGVFDMDTDTIVATLGSIYRVILNPYGDSLDDGIEIGHLAIYSTNALDGDTLEAVYGFSGDGTWSRVTRLCDEENIPLDALFGDAQFMGEQGTKTLVEMLREAEAAEQGLIFEHSAGLAFRRLPELYNRPEGLTLDCDEGHLSEPPEPTDDDQRLRNDVKVSRATGSFGRYESEDPAYAPNAIGRYDEELTLNLSTDTPLQRMAEWRVWLGTQDDLRWPRITFNMASRPELIPTWLRTRVADRCTVLNPPAGVPPTALELAIEGYTEVIGETEWTVTLNCSPMRPYEIATVEGDGSYEEPAMILDSETSTLNASRDTDDTSFSVATTGGVLWSTSAAPFDIEVGGEQITVTAVSGASSPQTFTVTRSVNSVVKSHASGAAITLWRPPVLGL